MEVGESEVGESEVGESEVGESEVGESEVGESEVGESEEGGVNSGSRENGEGACRIECEDSESTKEVSWEVGDWVVVLYDGIKYPGEVKKVVGKQTEVDVMVKTGPQYFKWPNGERDILWYSIDKVLKKTSPPTLVGSRGQSKFVDL
jgi:hypothetical protein